LFEAARGIHRPKLGGLLVPGPRLFDIGSDASDAKLGDHGRIIGGRKRQGRFGIAGFGGTLERQACRNQVADAQEMLALLDEEVDVYRR